MMLLSASMPAVGALAMMVLLSLVSAQNYTNTAASTFYLQDTNTQFSLNVANDSDHVYLYFSSPAYSWVGVGFGDSMDNSLMLIMYSNAKGDNVTISPRLGAKATEPTFNPNVEMETLAGTTVDNNEDMLVLKARCRNCRSWSTGSLNVNSTAQPMIFAFGNGLDVDSNSAAANLRRHVRYGHFTMDLVAATGAGGVPANRTANQGTKLVDLVKDGDGKNFAHAAIGCIALFVLWPFNVMIAGFFRNIKIHIGVSVVIFAFLVLSFVLGIVTSAEYNRSRSYTSPHQIVAFISLLPFLLLPTVSLPKLASLAPSLRALHLPLISVTFVLLVLSGGLGLRLSSQATTIILAYTVVALLIFVLTTTLLLCIRHRGSAYTRSKRTREPSSDHDIVLRKVDDSRNDSLGSMGAEPAVSTPGLAPAGYQYPPQAIPPTYPQQQIPAAYGEASNSPIAHAFTPPPVGHESREFGAHGQQQWQQQAVQGHGRGLSNGPLPGPQYLLNMHPGVPVPVGRL